MQLKFFVTLAVACGFLFLYFLVRRRTQQFEQAPTIHGEVLEVFVLDPQESKFDFTIDRGEALGNFIKIQYTQDGIEKVHEITLFKNQYEVGQTVPLKYIDDDNIILSDEPYSDKKMTLSFLICFVILFLAGSAGIAMDLSA
jgi:hypothetical protein